MYYVLIRKAFCECFVYGKGLDPLETKLAVVADTKRQGSVVLAATPKLKEIGIKTGSRLLKYHIVVIFILLIQV